MKWYHENGKLEQIGNYKNGKQEGEWKLYHENGKLEELEIIKMESEKENGNCIVKMES